MLILLNIVAFVIIIMCYVIWNLYNKNVKLEEALIQRDFILGNISDLIKDSGKKLEEVDRLGAFKSDDEVGFFFTAVKDIQKELDKFKF